MVGDIKADEAKRIIAGAIDFGVALIGFFILGYFLGKFIACLIAAAFLLLRDSPSLELFDGASPGKKMVGLKVLQVRGRTCDHVASIKRNLTIASFFLVSPILVIVFAVMPFIDRGFGYLVGAGIGALCLGVELYEVMTDLRGRRLGDLLAGTRVIETAFQGVDSRQWMTHNPEAEGREA
ncbi:MAG: RDD family protein [Acidobacteriota bacterium]|nr:RDD family protein [Acidobacteriota bacterium]